jgi:hypothetical protein
VRPASSLPAIAFALVTGTAFAGPAADSIRYVVQTTDVNNVGLTTGNYGFFGTNFNSRAPSFEFPLGSGYEHMSRAGLWVGAVALTDTGLFTGVSSAIVDNAQGTNALAEVEFTPAGNALRVRSRIQNSRNFSPDAVSDQDIIATYSDQPARNASGLQSERHTPLDILVRQQVLGFSLRGADDFAVVRFTVINQGPPLRDLWIGLYVQFATGDKNAYATWPPSAASGPGSWYYKAHIDYDADRRLYREHYCAALPYPDACLIETAPPWAGLRLLDAEPGGIAGHAVGFHWWSYSPGDAARDTDAERYAILSNATIDSTAACAPGTQCSPIAVLSVGPFAQVDPGDSVTVDYAFVGGEDEADLLANADFAQFASDIDYRLPAPPPSPRLRVEPRANALDLYWDESPEFASDPTSEVPGGLDFEGYRLYLGFDRQSPTQVAQFDLVDSTGFNTGLAAIRLATPHVVDGVAYHYRYRIGDLRDGFKYYGAVTSYDLGDPRVGSLESGLAQNKFVAVPAPSPGERAGGVTVFPNPYRVEARWDIGEQVRDHYLWFANLPPRAVIRVYTLSGDLVYETRFDGATYRGEGARGLYDPRQDLDTAAPALSGASYAWNLITSEGQAIASGLYLWSVEDLAGGGVERGKFLVVKSDREGF